MKKLPLLLLLILSFLLILTPIKSVLADSLTVYPDPGTGATTVDGVIQQYYPDNSGITWAAMIDAGGSHVYNTINPGVFINFESDTTGRTNLWCRLHRSLFLFDTSALGAGATINSATLSLYGNSKTDGLSVTPDINIYSSNPASDDILIAGDFDTLGTTAFSDTAITYAGFSTVGYNAFTFNAAGKAAITKDGISKFGARNANYDVSETPPNWTAGSNSYLEGYYADEAGTTKDPKLVIDYDVVVIEGWGWTIFPQ